MRGESGGEHAALQTLRETWGVWQSRQRMECGVFSTAFERAEVFASCHYLDACESAAVAPALPGRIF